MRSRAISIAVLLFLLSTAVDAQQASVRELYQSGEQALLSGDYYAAIEQFKLSLAQNPRYLEPTIGLAESFFYLGEYSEALDYVLRAQGLDRGNLALLNLEGRIRVGLGDFDAAKTLFDRVLRSEPNNLGAWFGMAELDIAFGKTTSATDRYQQALRVSPQNRRALLSLILILDEQGREREAASFVEDALRYHPQNAQVRLIAAKHYRQEGNLSEAEYQAKRALELAPADRDASLLLGEIYLETGQNERAVTVLEELIAVDREQPLVWYTLGTAYRKLSRIDEAMNAFGSAFRYQPDDEISRISLERLIIDNLDLDDPRRAQFAQYHFNLGRQYQDRNFLDRALRSYRRGLLIDPHSMNGRLLYADVFRVQGFTGKYLNELQVLLDLGYSSPEIADSIEIQESLRKGSVSDDWGVNQYGLTRQEYELDVFVGSADLMHPTAEADLGSFFRSLLLHRERLRVPRQIQTNVGYGKAFETARTNASDYFLILNLVETERHFATVVSMYSSRTGSQLDEFRVIRTGNSRVTDALNLLADDIDKALPVSAEIIDRQFDTTLIDAGTRDGVAVDDELLIIKRSGLSLATDHIGFDYAPEDAIGTVKITRTDELVSEGTLKQSQFFDLVNIGDRLIYAEQPPPTTEGSTPTLPTDLYRRIIGIK